VYYFYNVYNISVRHTEKCQLIQLHHTKLVSSFVPLSLLPVSSYKNNTILHPLCVSVGRQTTAPAAVSAVAGTTAGIVEQGKVISVAPLLTKSHILHFSSVAIQLLYSCDITKLQKS